MSNIFSEQTPAQDQSQGQDALTTKLMSITNENGEPKYANVETALDALKASQEFIPGLKTKVSEQEAQLAQLREELAKSTGVAETLQRFSQAPSAESAETPSNEVDETQDVSSLVQQAFKAHLEQTAAEKNFERVQGELVSKYGDKASEHIANRAKALNTTPEYLENLSKSNPTLALTLLGHEASKTPSMTYGGTNTIGLSNTQIEPVGRPAKSLLMGARQEDVSDFMAKIRDEVYREHGITQ